MTNENLKQETKNSTKDNSAARNTKKGVHHRNYTKKLNDTVNEKSIVKTNHINVNLKILKICKVF